MEKQRKTNHGASRRGATPRDRHRPQRPSARHWDANWLKRDYNAPQATLGPGRLNGRAEAVMRSFRPNSPFSILLLAALACVSPSTQAQKATRPVAPSIQANAAPIRHPELPHCPGTISSVHKLQSQSKAVNAKSPEPKALTSLLLPAPGPGFEFGFLNGVNSGAGPANPRGNGRVRNDLGFDSGLFLLGGEGEYAAPSGDSSAESVDGQEPADQAPDQAQDQSPAQQSEEFATEQPPSEIQEPAVAPVKDEGEFTLVMRDGSRISAVAFTHSSDKIIYISMDGLRLTFASADLDADATVRVNQERGTSLQLPL
jgi:hypothetical protein